MAGDVLRRARPAEARPRPRGRRRDGGRAGRPDAAGARADPRATSGPDAVLVYGDTNSTLAGALAAAKLGHPGRPRRGRPAELRPADARGDEPGRRPTTSRAGCSPRRRPRSRTSPPRGSATGVVLVGDLMQDLAARVAGEVRDARPRSPPIAAAARGRPRARAATSSRRSTGPRTGPPTAIRAWAAILAAAARPDRPVVLALHPGTRAALEASGVDAAPPDVYVVEPQGYRSTLALQLHAAAVLTDSGGVQREAAWLGVPCLVLRGIDGVGRGGRGLRRARWSSSGSMRRGPRPSSSGSRRPGRRAGAGRGRAPPRSPPAGGRRRRRSSPRSRARRVRVVMFVRNDVLVDARVLKEAGIPARRRPRRHDHRDQPARGARGRRARAARRLRRSSASRCRAGGAGGAGSGRRRGSGRSSGAAAARRARGWTALDWLAMWRFGTLGWARAAAREAGPADVYHGHDLTGLPAAVFARRLHGPTPGSSTTATSCSSSPAATVGRPSWAVDWLARREREWAAEADALVTVNDGYADELRPRLGSSESSSSTTARRGRSSIVPHSDLIRDAAGIPAGAPIVLYHGGLRAGRGIERAGRGDARAGPRGRPPRVPRVRARHARRSASWPPSRASAGGSTCSPGPAARRRPLGRVGRRRGDGDPGHEPELLPLDAEQAVRGFAAGVPVVASDFPGFRAIVADDPDGPLGELCDPADPASIGRAIRRDLELPPEARADCRRAVPAGGRERWNWETESARLVELYARPGDAAGESGARGSRAGPRSACTLVLPSSGAFDSRAWRIASALAARGHTVTVLARLEPGLPEDELHPAGYRIIRVPVSAAAGLPGPLRALVDAVPAPRPAGGGPGAARGEPQSSAGSPPRGRRPGPIGLRPPSSASPRSRSPFAPSASRRRPLAPAGRPRPRHGLHGHPDRARPRPARRRAGRLRRPRHLRRRRERRPAARPGPPAVRAGRAALGAAGEPRGDRQPAVRRGDGAAVRRPAAARSS